MSKPTEAHWSNYGVTPQLVYISGTQKTSCIAAKILQLLLINIRTTQPLNTQVWETRSLIVLTEEE